ncbi:MAG: tetratricopeptide repeat protein [Chloroflexi bacterium]|nr:tetratricopeptide repeat protein [Chloroflexota bacterium]
MIADQPLEKRRYRLAQHYLSKLRAAETTYHYGHENCEDALALFDQEWPQIKQWHDWSVAHADEDDEMAALCKEFSQVGAELLVVRLHPEERLQWLEAGLAAARSLRDQPAEMVHLYLLARTLRRTGPFDKALDAAQQALVMARQLKNRLYIAKLLNVLGGIFYFQNAYELAQQNYEQALALSKELQEKHEIGLSVNGLGTIAQMQGDFAHAYSFVSEYLEISEANGQPYNICMALRNLSMITMYMGHAQAATQYAERCVGLCEVIGFHVCLVGVLVILGDLASAQGNFTEARDYYLRSLEISRQINHPTNEAFVLCQLGRLFRQFGDIPTSLEHLEPALYLSNRLQERWYTATALVEMVATFRVGGDIPQARLKLLEGLEIACEIDSSAIHLIYLLEAALVWPAQGQTVEASVWMGALKENFRFLAAESHLDYDNLYHKLETELGPTQFAAAIERGKSLDVGSLLQEIWQELKSSPNRP